MRCKNCGWPNKPGVAVCVKCNSPLSGGGDESTIIGSGIAVPPPSAPAADEPTAPQSSLKKTVFEGSAFGGGGSADEPQRPAPIGDATELPASPGQPEITQCPKCGYPVRPGSDKCPNCKFPLGGQQAPAEPQRPAASNHPRRPTVVGGGDGPAPKLRGTINPYMMQIEEEVEEPTFVLKPIQRYGERNKPADVDFKGSEVILNRENTEPNNQTITSNTQAVVTNEDGHWYIEDRSGQGTTFVQASKKIELHEGDVILLGNRLFEFGK